jgi:hypothetical protein
MKKLILFLLFFSGCSTPVLVNSGPKWQLKVSCEMRAVSKDYFNEVYSENKCGGCLEVVILQGGK